MIRTEAEALLADLFIAFPSLRRWLAETPEPNQTYDVWVRTLEGCSDEDARAVLDQLTTGELDLPVYGQVAIVIRREANRIRSRINAKRRMRRMNETAAERRAVKQVLASGIGRIGIDLAELVKYGAITAEQNQRLLDELMMYGHGKIDRPDWLDRLPARLSDAKRNYQRG